MRKVVASLAAVVLLLMVARPAVAGTPGASDESAQLVRQAIALIVNTPGNMVGIKDKIVDAQDAPHREGVAVADVALAQQAFERGDMHQTRALLERSIGAQPHLGNAEPLPIRQTRGATGAQTGIDVVTDGLRPDRDVSGGDVVVLVALLGVAAVGVLLALRFRPPTMPEVQP